MRGCNVQVDTALSSGQRPSFAPKSRFASLQFAGYLICLSVRENIMATTCEVVIAWAIGVLLTSTAIAADTGANTSVANASGAMPGDDALTCEQIYAQGMAEAQRDQQERSQRNEQLRAQRDATGALITGAMLAGGLGGTGQAAQMAVEAQADKQMGLLSAPRSNPRMENLKRLWAQKHCVMK